jgi:hypothetical protein
MARLKLQGYDIRFDISDAGISIISNTTGRRYNPPAANICDAFNMAIADIEANEVYLDE